MQARAKSSAQGSNPLESVLDHAVVDELRALAQAGSPELLHRLEASFARDTPVRLIALREAVATGDADALAFNVHTLKGTAANLGATAIVAICQKIESFPGAGAEELGPLLTELERNAAAATAELGRMAETGW